MIDFSLSTGEAQARTNAAALASGMFAGAQEQYSRIPNDGVSRFQSTKPLLAKATEMGLIKSLIPPPLGGTGGSLTETALIVEELYAVEPSVSLTFFSIGLGLSPLLTGGTPAQQKEFLAPFLSGQGAPLASFVFTEPTGSANYFEEGGAGIQTTATPDGDNFVVSGEKIWATNSAGWDMKGPDLSTLVCRDTSITSSATDSALLLLIPGSTIESNPASAFAVVAHHTTPGHTATSGPHIKYTDLRVPKSHVLARGASAARLITSTFTPTAAMVGAMSVGLMRATFDCALSYTKSHTAGGPMPLLHRQSVADLLIEIKMRTEAARSLTWRAAWAFQNGVPGAEELCSEAKIWCSEQAVKAVAEAMRAVGVSSYSEGMPLVRLMNDAAVLPIFDGGNQGVRRREVQRIFEAEGYQAWGASFGTVDRVEGEEKANGVRK